MATLTKRETVLKKRVAKTKALKKGKVLKGSRDYSSKYDRIQKNNVELLKKLRSESGSRKS